MARAEALVRAALPTPPVAPRGFAFGLELRAAEDREWAGAATRANGGTRSVTMLVEDPGAFRARWRGTGSRALAVRGGRPGRPMLRIEQEDSGDYRVWAPGHGRHVIANDGTLIRSSVPRPPDDRWFRLFLAQPLPLAAALHGLELFHASAVQVGEAVLGFVASSGTGKTSLAAQLVGRGATFVTDDVLALEVVDDVVVAHSGPRWLCLDEEEAHAMPPGGQGRLGPVIGKSDKLHFAPSTSAAPAPVTTVFFLYRDHDVASLEFREIDVLEPRRLFSSVFLSYLDEPRILVRTLDFCARFARLVRPIEVRVPPALGSGTLADEVLGFTARELA